jgi:methylated-DNA-[protein]-cysteine S-methyltransferase
MNHLQFRVAVGTIAVTWNSFGHLTRIDWYDNCGPTGLQQPELPQSWTALAKVGIPPLLEGLVQRLRLYFEQGEPLGELPWEAISQESWSEFQCGVYRALASIPHGETRTYAWVARRIGKLGKLAAPRAVGQALRKNPLPILIPCHRVVSADDLGGFMGITDPDQPELKLKRWLIELENSYLNPSFSFLAPVGGSFAFEAST